MNNRAFSGNERSKRLSRGTFTHWCVSELRETAAELRESALELREWGPELRETALELHEWGPELRESQPAESCTLGKNIYNS